MEAVSVERREMARKNGAKIYASVLQRLAEVTQERAADCMGVSASTISRDKEDLERACHLLAALGFQVARTNSMLIDRDELRVMKRMVVRYLQADLEDGEV